MFDNYKSGKLRDDTTKEFLNLFALHAADRRGYRGKDLTLHISTVGDFEGNPGSVIRCYIGDTPVPEPSIFITEWVYNHTVEGKRRRKFLGKVNIFDHIIRSHLPEVAQPVRYHDKFEPMLVPGTYIYKMSVSGKARRWYSNNIKGDVSYGS